MGGVGGVGGVGQASASRIGDPRQRDEIGRSSAPLGSRGDLPRQPGIQAPARGGVGEAQAAPLKPEDPKKRPHDLVGLAQLLDLAATRLAQIARLGQPPQVGQKALRCIRRRHKTQKEDRTNNPQAKAATWRVDRHLFGQ